MKPSEKELEQIRVVISNVQVLERECWEELKLLFYTKKLKKHDYFSKEDQLITELGLVAEGIFRIFYLNEKGEEWNKHFLQKNEFIGSSVSPEKKSITNIQALTEARVFCISYPQFAKLSEKYKSLNLFFQKLISSYLEQKHLREISLLSGDSMNNYLFFKKKYPDLEDKIQHYHIASYLGITPTQLSRLRKKLKIH